MRERSLKYKLNGLNLPLQRRYLRYSVFIVVSSKKEWISKSKNYRLTCTENLVIKLVEVEPLVC